MNIGTLKYGLKWGPAIHPVQIELSMIKDRRGQNDLFTHYKSLQSILWPWHEHNRWSDLCLQEILENKMTVLMGPKSTQKTHCAAMFALCDLWAHPECTGILVSSTDMRGLKMRIWAEIAKLFNDAREVYPPLPGRHFPSVPALSMDDIDENSMRDLRNGMIGVPCRSGTTFVGLGAYVGFKNKRVRLLADECFPAGTGILTPTGYREIQDIRPGQKVVTAVGLGKVVQTSRRLSQELVRVTMKDGRFVLCTPEHRFLTSNGWKKAVDLDQSCYMVSPYESMQAMWCRNKEQSLLQQELCREVYYHGSGTKEEILHERACQEDRRIEIQDVQGAPGILGSISTSSVEQSMAETTGEQEISQREVESSWSQTEDSRGEWNRTNQSRTATSQIVSILEEQLCGCHSRTQGKRISATLQSGCGFPEHTTRNRSRRIEPFLDFQKKPGLEKNCEVAGAWVDRVEIEKQEDFGGNGSRGRGVEVFNLQVDRHPSYCVEGFVAHNCSLMGHSFLDGISNLDANPNFKAVFMGNPLDPLDPLGRAAEPEEGWTGQAEPEKTTVWKTRFMGGKCVNLVGTDSPNFDFPQDRSPRYPFLIHRENIESTVKFWGKDSLQYYSQCKGVMKVGLQGRRVITREMCRQHHAQEEAVWASLNRRKIFALDIAYGGVGGDRCVGGDIEFGIDKDGHQIIQVGRPAIVPVSVRADKIPEDQIAEWTFQELSRRKIPAKDCFYDSTGRGSIGSSFAKVFGHEIPVPVEFGGRPTRRPVRMDLYIYDEAEHRNRLKRCDEHYSKFVTELWYTVRYVIEADQMRGLPEDVMYEGCIREWKMVAGNKIEIETKDETRERMGRSPDLYDWLVTACEGARQRGFSVQRLGTDVHVEGRSASALAELADKWHRTEQSKRLTYA
jgi:hypothetical protein